ncbi:MAG: alanine dehydrogenase [Firmicutes bacterium]|nr:alanine dehydrogenase [Bacillota bacterium]
MIIGVPKEIKPNENRIALTPAGANALTGAGHQVFIETKAGEGSGFSDQEYINSGAEILPTPQDVFAKADMIMKVKEPLPSEYPLFKEGQILYTYLHLSGVDPELTKVLMEKKVVAIAYETVQFENGELPLLTPMSEVAGRMATQVGIHFLEKTHGGRGVLLGGVPGTPPAEVVVIGGGVVGTNAAKMAYGLGARVTILDVSPARMRYLDDIFEGNITTLMSNPYNIEECCRKADLLIGAVLIPGARAPRLVTEDMVKQMREGAVIVDVAIDQGGSIETIDRVTTHAEPTYVRHGVVHYSVANMPGAVPRTSTIALTNVTLKYALDIANKGYAQAIKDDPALALGVNTYAGQVVYEAVANDLGHKYVPLKDLL